MTLPVVTSTSSRPLFHSRWAQWMKLALVLGAGLFALWPGGARAMSEVEIRDLTTNALKMVNGGFGWGVLATLYAVYFGVSLALEYFFAKLFCEGTVKKVIMVTVLILIIGSLQSAITHLIFPDNSDSEGAPTRQRLPGWYGLVSLALVIYTDVGVRQYVYGSGGWRNFFIGLANRLLTVVGTVLLLFFVVVPSVLDDLRKKRDIEMAESSRRLEAELRAEQEQAQLRMQIDTAYKSLSEKKKTLNVKDPKAVEAFNVEAARYHELQKRFRERQGPPAVPAAPAPASSSSGIPGPGAK